MNIIFSLLGIGVVVALLYEAVCGCCKSPECLRRQVYRAHKNWL
jgi:hypothetical protein